MKWHEQHEAFKKLAIQQGISKREQIDQALPLGITVPEAKLEKWLNRLLLVPRDFAPQRRYINRFKLGADPEFIFVRHGERVDARTLGLQQGLAFGMDNNGRLTEIRPHPSRSALEVVASILATLRWLAVLHPETLPFDWQAGAFLQGDGLGGHVHFGRKRPGRDIEVKALDVIEEELLSLKAYPVLEVLRRRQGDGKNHPYGLPGDIRKQIHGYEYRTFPSWLDSPELAFFTLVLSKLAVQFPHFIQGYMPFKLPDRYFQRIWNLLSCFKDVDDDARLALCMISRKLPVHIGGDFKSRWGIAALPIPGAADLKIKFLPSSIQASKADIDEMFEHLANGTLLGGKIPTPTWFPLYPPSGYVMTLAGTNTYAAKGLGELLWDVVNYKDSNYQFINDRGLPSPLCFSIPNELANTLASNWKIRCQHKIKVHFGDPKYIYSSEKMREVAVFAECRRILLETVLPFWRISEVKPDSILQWKSMQGLPKSRSRFADEVLYASSEFPYKELR